MNTQKNYTKSLNEQDDSNDVVIHPESDNLECEVKWVLGSIANSKASGGDRISAELFKILNDDAIKVLHSICQQIWKMQPWHRTGKCLFLSQYQRKAVLS